MLPKRCAHIGSRELRLIFENLGSRTIEVGQLQQDTTIPARLDIDETLSEHFAVLGTTGVGKSARRLGTDARREPATAQTPAWAALHDNDVRYPPKTASG